MTIPAEPSTAERAAVLRGCCGGAVHLPGDPHYDLARSAWNLQVDDYPAAVVYPAFADEVADVLRGAATSGLRVAPQGTGHGAAPQGGRLSEAVLLRTGAMTELRIDPERRTARVGAGVLWGDVSDAAGAHGLASLHPSSPDVGVVGYTIGGGLSWYARQHGLACNAVTAIEVVLADGTFVRADAEHDTELFWGLRGGGAPLGVVTAIELDLLPVDTVVAGFLAWDWTAVERVLPGWVDWTRDAPEFATTALRLLLVPALPEIPSELHGRRLVVVDGAVLADDVAAAEVLSPLRALGPDIDTVQRVPAASVPRLHLDPEGPTPAYATSSLIGELPDAALAAVMDAVGPGSDTGLDVAELRQLGGALSRPDPRGGALSALDGRFLALGIGIELDPAGWPRARAEAARFLTALEPWSTGTSYLPMLHERGDTRKAFPPGVHARLSALRRAVDPHRLFLAPHESGG